MAKALLRCLNAMEDNGRLVVVFANKEVAAWETLIAARFAAGQWTRQAGRFKLRWKTGRGA
jgi:adenine-specific DNA methylase